MVDTGDTEKGETNDANWIDNVTVHVLDSADGQILKFPKGLRLKIQEFLVFREGDDLLMRPIDGNGIPHGVNRSE
ncbi:MAG: hypothetical protein LBR80_13560 [Deltaproteobacteria bacterium]|jgi:hypothetical protein|nr:hypothetical protein [Deltaproteobacteria bacterium]